MGRELSYCIRKKLERPHMLYGFEDVDQFVRRLKRHGIRIRKRYLEECEREGWLRPAFRLVLPEDLRQDGLCLGMDAIRRFHAKGCVEIPQSGDYEPWDSFKANPKRIGRDGKLLYYHPFQILQVKNVLAGKQTSFLCLDSYTRSDIEGIVNRIVADRSRQRNSFNAVQAEIARRIGMLMLVEESYGIHVYHSMLVPLDVPFGSFMEQWREWKSGFTAGDLLTDCGSSAEQVRAIRDWAVLCIRFSDPLRSWHDLVRIMRPRALETVEGEVRTALMYRHIAGMLTRFLHDLGGEEGEPDMPLDDADAEWKRRVYSDPLNYGTHKTRQAIVRRFIRDTSTRLYLLVEGKTEVSVIERICGMRGISLADDIVMVLDREGVANISAGNIRWLIQTARKDSIAIYIIADNEGKLRKEIGKIEQEFDGQFGCRIWEASFEEDNFGRADVIGLINSYLSARKQCLSDEDVSARQRHKKGLVAAAEDAYYKKYKEKLRSTMGKNKVDLALELVDKFYQNAGNDGADKLEIEKALDEALAMVTA